MWTLRLSLFLALVIPIPSFAGGAPKRETAWDCIRRVLATLEPERPPIETAVERLGRELGGRSAVSGVGTDVSKGHLLVNVTTAQELRRVEAHYGFGGYEGYGVTTEISFDPPGVRTPFDETDPRHQQKYVQGLLVELTPEGVELRLKQKKVPYSLQRPPTVESKISFELRAQLASDAYRVEGSWNAERRILISVRPVRLDYHQNEEIAYPGIGVPTFEDVRDAVPALAKAFRRKFETRLGMQVRNERAEPAMALHSYVVTLPSASAFRTLLSEENVSSADAYEHFND